MERYRGFTLVEMLLVMAIFIIVMAIGISSFSGVRDSSLTNELTLTIAQDIRDVQRSAMLLDRDRNERWLYGIGIDLSQIGTTGTYSTFKWCSRDDNYGDSLETKGEVPNYNPSYLLNNGTNGKLLTGSGDNLDSCPKGTNVQGLLSLGKKVQSQNYDSTYLCFPEPQVRYIVFEAVSGRAFFYDVNGFLLNYVRDNVTGKLSVVDNPVFAEITMIAPGTMLSKKLVISPISGVVSIKNGEKWTGPLPANCAEEAVALVEVPLPELFGPPPASTTDVVPPLTLSVTTKGITIVRPRDTIDVMPPATF